MSQYQNSNQQFTPPPRKRSALEDAKLTLVTDNGHGRRATLRFSINSGKDIDNNIRVDVYTNIPDDGNNGHSRIILDIATFSYFISEAERVLRSKESTSISVQQQSKRWMQDQRKFSDEKYTVATMKITKEEDGKVFLAVLNNKSTPLKFYLMPMGDFNFLRKDNRPVTDAELCVGYGISLLGNIRKITEALYLDQYKEPERKPAPGAQGQSNSGGQRNNSGGGGNNNYQNNRNQNNQQASPQNTNSGGPAPAATTEWGGNNDSYNDGFDSL